MDIALPNSEKWYSLNEEIAEILRDRWNIADEFSVRLYGGLHQAAFDVCLGTAGFLVHKKSVGWLKGQTYGFSAVLPLLYRDSFDIQSMPQKNSSLPWSEWLQRLKKDTSFVMMAEDHPVTGEIFDTSTVDKELNEKKIFSVQVNHQKWRTRPPSKINPHSVHILEVNQSLALVLTGARYRSPVLFSHLAHWDRQSVLPGVEKAFSEQEDKTCVEHFEKYLPAHFEKLVATKERLWNRSLIFSRESNGEALSRELQNYGVETLALTACEQGFAEWDWWEDSRPTLEQVRGALLLDLKNIKRLADISILSEAQRRCQI